MLEQRYYSLNDKFDFGKHNGKTLDEVLSIERSYIPWCHQKVDHFLLSEDVIDKYGGEIGKTHRVTTSDGRSMTLKEFWINWNSAKIEKEEKRIRKKEELERMYERHNEEREEMEQLKRDAFSDGDGTELWSFENE